MRKLPYPLKPITNDQFSFVIWRKVKADPRGLQLWELVQNTLGLASADWVFMRVTTDGFIRRIQFPEVKLNFPRMQIVDRGASSGKRPNYREATLDIKED